MKETFGVSAAAFLSAIFCSMTPASAAAIGRDLLDADITSPEQRVCPQALSNSGSSDPFRYLLEIGEGGGESWSVRIESGWLRRNIEIPEDRKDDFSLILTDRNSSQGMRVLTPLLNTKGNDGYCVIVEGEPPPLTIRGETWRKHDRPTALSTGGRSKYDPANLISAAEVWAECENGPCTGLHDFPDPFDAEGQRLPNGQGALWKDGSVLSREDKLARLRKAFRAVVYLESVGYKWRYDAENDINDYALEVGAGGRCTGFLIALRIIATNVHCLYSEYDFVKGVPQKTRPNVLYGWLRPIEGGQYERDRAPDFQQLTPIFVGRRGGADFALLWIEDANIGETRVPELPPPLPLSPGDWRPPNGMLLTAIGYPLAPSSSLDRLVVNFDGYCRVGGELNSFDNTRNIKHLCDTEGGASGSPLWDRELEQVVAIHFGGYIFEELAKDGRIVTDQCGDKRKFSDCYNSAMPIASLREELAKLNKQVAGGKTDWLAFSERPPPGVWPYHDVESAMLIESYRQKARQVLDEFGY